MPDPKKKVQANAPDSLKNAPRMSQPSNQNRVGTGEDKSIKYATLKEYKPKAGEDKKPTTVGGKPYTGKLYTKHNLPQPKYKK